MMLEQATSPVLDIQRAMNGQRQGQPAADRVGGGSSYSGQSGDFSLEVGPGGVDLNVPRYVGGLVLLGGATLFLLRIAGFRFSYGARIGGSA